MSNRGGEIKLSLKERIAALGLEGHGAASSSSAPTGANSNSLSTTYSTGSSPTPVAGVRDKAARFESIGGVPVPRGSFGLGAPPAFSNLRKTGELYGNRIPSGNGRSPGSSPGRSPADDAPEFTRIRLRSTGSTGSLGETGTEIDTSTWIQVIPPTPAFPPPEFSPRKQTDEVHEAISSSPEPVTAQASQNDEVKANSPLTPTNTPQEVEVPNAVSRVQELDSIPESPVADQTTSTSLPPPRKASTTSTASKRRSLVLKNSTASTSTNPSPSPRSATTEPANPSTSRRSSLAPSATGSPRTARSQAPSRASSVSSTSSVFTSPPSDEGEIGGGGYTGSPTLETLGVDVWEEDDLSKVSPSSDPPFEAGFTQEDEVATASPAQPPSPHISTVSIPNTTPDMVMDGRSDASSPERSSPLMEEIAVAHIENPGEEKQSAGDPQEIHFDAESAQASFAADPFLESSPSHSMPSELQEDAKTPENETLSHPPLGDANQPGSLVEESTSPGVDLLPVVIPVPETEADSVASLSAPTTNRRDLLAETASPAKVLRELRQLGMEKQSSIVIVSPRRASVLSMMMPPATADSGPSNDENQEGKSVSRDVGMAPTRHLGHTGSPTDLPPTTQAADVMSHLMAESPPAPKKDYATGMNHASRDLSPTAASVVSIPQSFSGTSDASYARLSFASSLREMVTPPSNFVNLEPARPSSDYAPSFLVPPSPKSSVPFVSETQDTTRNLTPSPPASFRSLYTSGRLPPSSRGPGPHLPSGKVPLLQRAVTLMTRSLPPIPRDELPPRRSSSAFHAIRSRTSSKAKREQAKAAAPAQPNASERASTSSDITITEDLPPRLELVQPRARTSSSPLVISVSRSAPPPVPPLPPIVTLNDAHPITPPIARLFMEQRNGSAPNQPPTAFRSGSPAPSMSSAQASMSSCAGNPSHLFSPSFDEGIFDAFPEVPGDLPSSSVAARHSRLMATGAAGRGHLGMLPNRSFSELEDRLTGSYSGRIEASKSQDGHIGMQSRRGESPFTATTKSVHAPEMGDPTSAGVPPVRRKAPSRKLIPGWYDDDDEGDGDNDTGWASVQVIRSRLM